MFWLEGLQLNNASADKNKKYQSTRMALNIPGIDCVFPSRLGASFDRGIT